MNNDTLTNVPQNGRRTAKKLVTPFPDFNDWFAAIIKDIRPSYIVGIARGAVRFLQLQQIKDIIGNTPILSDHALPLLSEDEVKSKKILLFDDTVIFGSTLSEVRKYLLERGAVVFSVAYIIDRFNFYGEEVAGESNTPFPSVFSDIPIRAKHLMPPSAIRRHHNILIDSVLSTPRDYNLDFAKFRVKTAEYSLADIPHFIRRLLSLEMVREIHDVTYPASAVHGIYRYTALLDPRISRLLAGCKFSVRPYSKLRITFIPAAGEVHFTPLPQLTLSDGVKLEEIKFKSRPLQSLWKSIDCPIQRTDIHYQKSVFRLLTAFSSIVLGTYISKSVFAHLHDVLPINDINLIDEDIETTLGVRISNYLKLASSKLNSLNLSARLGADSYELLLDYDEYLNQRLLTDIKNEWEKNPSLKPHDGELIYEDLGRVFLTLRAVTDNPERRRQNPGSSRLDVGLSYEAIRLLLDDECGVSRTKDEISIAMDLCVDNGQAVPKVIKQEATWLRAFYSGEAEDSHPTFQLKDAIHKAYSEYLTQKNVKPLNQFEMHKLCVTLRDIFRWIPITTKPYTYGRIAIVGSTQAEIVGWLVNRGSGPLRMDSDKESRGKLVINKDYQPCIYPSWPAEKSQRFFDAFHYIAIAFSKLKGDEPKLLLSTCRTHRHAYNAAAFEIHSWVEHRRADFRRGLTAARISPTGGLIDRTVVAESLFWCVQFINEAWKKHRIFYNSFKGLEEKLRKAFESQGTGAAHFWQYIIVEDGLLNSTIEREIELKFKNLMLLAEQISLLTAYLTAVLLDMGLISKWHLQKAFEKEGHSIDDKGYSWLTSRDPRLLAATYNNNIKQKTVAAPSIERTLLPEQNSPLHSTFDVRTYQDIHTTIQTCFDELGSSMSRFCPRYQCQEGEEFPFAPEEDKRTLVDGSTEQIHKDIFILTAEIIKSTNNFQTNSLKDYVLKTFDDFKSRGLYYDTTGNDAFLACSYDPEVLWDIARLLMQEGERLKSGGGDFGGMRKGLFFGTVRHVVNMDGHQRVQDAAIPNSLPQAFYTLNGIDERLASRKDDMNSVVIIPDFVIPKLTPAMNLQIDTTKTFLVSAKHFHGTCYCFSLLDGTAQ